jgi:hypothetical protein
MTIPKTLAALPSSQYATFFSLFSGKKAFFALDVDFAIAWAASKVGIVACRGTWVVWYRNWKKGDVLREGWKRRLDGCNRAAWWCLHVKNSLDRRGAAFLNRRKDWDMDAIVLVRAIDSCYLKEETSEVIEKMVREWGSCDDEHRLFLEQIVCLQGLLVSDDVQQTDLVDGYEDPSHCGFEIRKTRSLAHVS